jgi:hypothetical protein
MTSRGPHFITVLVGVVSTSINHYAVLRAIESVYGLAYLGNAESSVAISQFFGKVLAPFDLRLVAGTHGDIGGSPISLGFQISSMTHDVDAQSYRE